jgi:hypothetical protein
MFSAREHTTDLSTSASAPTPRLAAAFTRRGRCHHLIALALSSGVIACTGCTARQPPKPDQLTDSTIKLDPAMRTRDWDRSFAMYPNGAVVAGPTEFPFEPTRNEVGYLYYGSDFLAFATNLVVLPYSLIVTPPWTAQTYPGAVIPPTSTGVPLMPPTRTPEPPAARPLPPPPEPSRAPTFAPVPIRPMQPLTWPATAPGAPTTSPSATTTTSSAR